MYRRHGGVSNWNIAPRLKPIMPIDLPTNKLHQDAHVKTLMSDATRRGMTGQDDLVERGGDGRMGEYLCS